MNPYDRNRPYNDLPLLPPSEEKIVTIEILQALNKANKALAELKGLARKLPNQSMLVNTIALREAKASTEIENIFTTEEELYQALTINEAELKGNTKEVLNYRQALWTGYNHIIQKKAVDKDSLIKIYQDIKQVSDGIRPDHTETVIKKAVTNTLESKVIYTPPRGKKVLIEKLNNLLDFINDDIKYDYDPLLKLAISHYQFEAIHPFRDGNGRTGRVLSILITVLKNLLEVPILYLSAYVIKEKENYYDLLNKVTTQNNWTEWILFMLKAVEQTSVYTISKIEQIDRLFYQTLDLISKRHPHITKETVEKIFEQPYIKPKSLINKNIKSLNTAKKHLRQLEQLGIMTSKTMGKEMVFLNIDLYNLLSEY